MSQIPAYVPPPMDPQSGKTNSMAVASMIAGIAGLLSSLGSCCPCLCIPAIPCSIMGVVFGLVALNQIKTSGQEGRGMATAGLICGAVGLLIIVGLVLLRIIFTGAMFWGRNGNWQQNWP